MGIFGAPDVKKLISKKNITGLIKALNYKDDQYVQSAAVRALSVMGDSRAVKPLLKCLEDERLRENAALALGAIGDYDAVSPLIYILSNKQENDPLRINVAKALGLIGDLKAEEMLIAILMDKNEDEYVRRSCAFALGDIGDPRALDSLKLINQDDEKWLVNEPVNEAIKLIRANHLKDDKRIERLLSRTEAFNKAQKLGLIPLDGYAGGIQFLEKPAGLFYVRGFFRCECSNLLPMEVSVSSVDGMESTSINCSNCNAVFDLLSTIKGKDVLIGAKLVVQSKYRSTSPSKFYFLQLESA